MGYFSNGTEGMQYEDRWCAKCIHERNPDDEPCAVWELHMLHNYDECNKDDSPLHVLIPRDGINNGRCRMFVKRPAPRYMANQGILPGFHCYRGD